AVRIDVREGAMLRDTVRQTIHSIASRSFPIVSAGVVADALRLKNSRSQMADRIASKDLRFLSGRQADRVVQVAHNLRVRTRLVIKLPSRTRHTGPHIEAPSAEQLIGREVMLDEAIAPLNGRTHRLHRFVESF